VLAEKRTIERGKRQQAPDLTDPDAQTQGAEGVLGEPEGFSASHCHHAPSPAASIHSTSGPDIGSSLRDEGSSPGLTDSLTA